MRIELPNLVDRDPNKCGGVPVLRNTRFAVAQLIAELADSDSVGEIADDFDLSESQIREFLRELAASIE